MDRVPVLHFDGRTTRSERGWVAVEGDDLVLTVGGSERRFPTRSVSFTPAYARAPARIGFEDGATCEIGSADDYNRLRAAARRGTGWAERLETRWRYALGALVLVVACGVGGYVWGIPLAGEVLARKAPPWVVEAIGRSSRQQLETLGFGPPRELLTDEERHVTARFAALLPPDAPHYVIEFRTWHQRANAFALPDGHIVVTDGMEQFARGHEDALLFVLGHEMGHLYYRHSLQSLTRASLLSGAAAYLFGDVSSALAVLAGGLGSLHYSREFETQADDYGIALLRSHGISTAPAADLFDRIEASGGNAGPQKSRPTTASGPHRVDFPGYLSTHPATSERTAKLRSGNPVPPEIDPAEPRRAPVPADPQ